MEIQLVQKRINYGSFYLHHIFYKNLNATQLNNLCDHVSEFIYNENISLIGHCISANLQQVKNYLKAQKLTFGDVNWPETWLQNKNDQQNISGYYSGISACTVKTLVGDNFIAKIVESNNARYCFTGEINPLKNNGSLNEQTKQLFETIAKALFVSGLHASHIIVQQYCLKDIKNTQHDFLNLYQQNFETHEFSSETTPLNSIIGSANQNKSEVQSSFIAIKANNNNLTIDCANANTVKIKANNFENLFIVTSPNLDKILTATATEQQIENAISTIENILTCENHSWKNLVRGIAYFRTIKDAKIFKQICKDRKIPLSPILITETEFASNNYNFNFEADFAKEK